MAFGPYEVVRTISGFAVHYATPNCLREPISHHLTERDAKEAVKKYKAGDKRRGTVRRSGANTINDLAK
jgi:hypothetical protein